jgi:hypothetical protein
VNSDSVSSVTLTSSGAAATATVAGSPYSIVASAASGTGLGNYSITYHDGALTVNAKALTVAANNRSKTYGDAVTFAGTEFTTAGLVNSDTVTSVTLTSAGAPATATVGGYSIVPSAAVGSGVGNYTITYQNGTLTVNAKNLTVTANNLSKTYGDMLTFLGTEFTTSGLANSDTVTSVTLTSTGAPASATVAGSPYPILVSNAVGTGLGNYTISYMSGRLTVVARQVNAAYIGQTVFVTSGSSSTNAQVALSASIADPDGAGTIAAATATFTDVTTGKVLATGVKVTPVSNSDTHTGTANTVVTLSTGQYGAQQYIIRVTIGGSYTNDQQLTSADGSVAKMATTAITVMIPQTANTMQAAGSFTPFAPAGTLGDAPTASYSVGLKYNNKGTSPQGQIQLVLPRGGDVYYVKSNSISSLSFTGSPAKDATIYTKASIYKILSTGQTVSVDGGVTLRVDAHDGCSSGANCTGDTIGFTVLSSKDSSLYYSNSWQLDSTGTKSWRTFQQAVAGPMGVVIN